MSKADYYKVLGVTQSANQDELKRAYRALAMKYHPDRNQGDKTAEQKFREINEAYDVLKDEQKKAAYDRYGHAAFDGSGGHRASQGGAGWSSGFESSANFSDLFGDLFGDFAGMGRGSQTNNKIRGADLRYNLQISLEEAFSGGQRNIKFSASAPCSPCKATGSVGGGEAVSCAYCRGSGRIRSQQGFFTIEKTCASCHGAGKTIQDPCKSCRGEGKVQKEKTLSVSIPAGVETDTRIRLAGEGEAGLRGSPAGDLYIFISIAQHPLFSLDGADIHCKVPIKMSVAALGGVIEVPSIDGTRTKVTIAPGAQTGDKLRLRSKGMSMMRSKSRGDMYIHLAVETPVDLTKKQKELLSEFEEIATDDSNPKSKSFFKKVKDLWG